MDEPETWTHFVDDASALTDTPVQRPSPAIGARVVHDDDLPRLLGYAGDVRVALTGGAAQVAGPASYCARNRIELTAIETTLRDLDDPAGNVRRVLAAVDAARGEGSLADDVEVHVGVAGEPTYGWLAAADELAAAGEGFALSLPLDLPGDGVPGWIDAALDRELTFSLHGGTLELAVEALRTTARLWGDADDLRAARRWCRSWAAPDLDEALERLDRITRE